MDDIFILDLILENSSDSFGVCLTDLSVLLILKSNISLSYSVGIIDFSFDGIQWCTTNIRMKNNTSNQTKYLYCKILHHSYKYSPYWLKNCGRKIQIWGLAQSRNHENSMKYLIIILILFTIYLQIISRDYTTVRSFWCYFFRIIHYKHC